MPDTPAQQLAAAIRTGRTVRDLLLKGAYLHGLQLPGLRADGLDFCDATLREASLAGAHIRGCTLRDARLDRADFSDAVLRMCDLDDVRASDAKFTRARLENSTARGARFDGADFTGATLTDTDLSRASLHGARLDGVSATAVDLRGSDLRGASLRNAVLIDADLRGTDLTGADLHDANLHGADLRGAAGLPASLAGDVAPMVRELSETMAPIVAQVLRTAGRSGAIDADTAQRLIDEAARHQTAPWQRAPSPEVLSAVSRVIAELGDGVLPALTNAVRQPNQGEPPKEVQDVIRRLSQELSLDEGASIEDLLHRLTRGAPRR